MSSSSLDEEELALRLIARFGLGLVALAVLAFGGDSLSVTDTGGSNTSQCL
jgi:hypothetical protein